MPRIHLQSFSPFNPFMRKRREEKTWTYLYIFWFWSVLMARPFFVQLTLGLGMPVASQDKVVWTLTVTVTLSRPSAMDGGTGGEETITSPVLVGGASRKARVSFFTGTPTVDLQIHPFLLRPGLIGRHAQVPASVSHLSRVDVQWALLCKCVPAHTWRFSEGRGHVSCHNGNSDDLVLLCFEMHAWKVYLGLFPDKMVPCFLQVTRGGGTPLTMHSSTAGWLMFADTTWEPCLILGATDGVDRKYVYKFSPRQEVKSDSCGCWLLLYW